MSEMCSTRGLVRVGGPTENESEPVAVLGDHAFTELATGQAHVCALTDAGEAWCWGNNTFGQLGNGAKSNAARTRSNRSP